MKHLVVIPAYNEQQSLPAAVADLQQLATGPDQFDLLVVNDGSTDRTASVAEDLARRSQLPLGVLTHKQNRGIGAAVQAGYRWSRGKGYDFVIQFDGDGQHRASDVCRLIDACRRDRLDVCVGSRYIQRDVAQRWFGGMRGQGAGGHDIRPASTWTGSWARRTGTRWLSWLLSMQTNVRITDATSGLRCAGPRAVDLFSERYPTDYPEPVTLSWCARAGLKIGEIAVQMAQRKGGTSSIRGVACAYYMLKVTCRLLRPGVIPRTSSLSQQRVEKGGQAPAGAPTSMGMSVSTGASPRFSTACQSVPSPSVRPGIVEDTLRLATSP